MSEIEGILGYAHLLAVGNLIQGCRIFGNQLGHRARCWVLGWGDKTGFKKMAEWLIGCVDRSMCNKFIRL